ncbi:MAG: hypothetical protein KY476_20795 [Planctomycetes bacterium]|nr:hypothetical protein [Planctomycetota bacterium]
MIDTRELERILGNREPIVPGRYVMMGEPARVGPVASEHDEPQIEFVREGDRVRAIDVTCTCGERIRVRCLYEDA